MTTDTKADKWERRRQRQTFLNRCAELKRFAPQLNLLSSRKLWDRAACQANRLVEERSVRSDG
jgi:hypothetical protein